MHFIKALEKPTVDVDLMQRQGIAYLYLLNMLSRNPVNVKTLVQHNALAAPIQV